MSSILPDEDGTLLDTKHWLMNPEHKKNIKILRMLYNYHLFCLLFDISFLGGMWIRCSLRIPEDRNCNNNVDRSAELSGNRTTVLHELKFSLQTPEDWDWNYSVDRSAALEEKHPGISVNPSVIKPDKWDKIAGSHWDSRMFFLQGELSGNRTTVLHEL